MTLGWECGMHLRIRRQVVGLLGTLKHTLPILVFGLVAVVHAGELPYFHVISHDGGSWPEIFSSVGFEAQTAEKAQILVARAGSAASAELTDRVEKGAILVIEGNSPLAEGFGFKPG